MFFLDYHSVRFKKDFDITKVNTVQEGGADEAKDSDDEEGGAVRGTHHKELYDSDDEITPLDSRNKTPTTGSAIKL